MWSPKLRICDERAKIAFFLHDWTRKVREFSVWVGYLTKWSLRVLSATINILIICLGLPVVWTYSPASDQTPSWRSSRLPSNSWRSFNRWPPRSQNLGYCCLVFPCSSTWRVWIFLLFAFVFAISLHKVFTHSMSLRNTNNSFASGFWRWIHVSKSSRRAAHFDNGCQPKFLWCWEPIASDWRSGCAFPCLFALHGRGR